MATNLLFSRLAALVSGRNQVTTFTVSDCSSIRIYAYLQPPSQQTTLYLINPDLHDVQGTDPNAGALDKIVLNALDGRTAWYALPGVRLSIEAYASGPAAVQLYVYGEKYPSVPKPLSGAKPLSATSKRRGRKLS